MLEILTLYIRWALLWYIMLLRQRDLDIVSRCTIASSPHWNQALNRGAGKVRSLQGSYERFYAVIFTTSSRQPHRCSSCFKTSRSRACIDSAHRRQGSSGRFAMIPNEDFYPPAHKTIIKLRYVALANSRPNALTSACRFVSGSLLNELRKIILPHN